jgi:hypothetical protein
MKVSWNQWLSVRDGDTSGFRAINRKATAANLGPQSLGNQLFDVGTTTGEGVTARR